MTLQPIPFDISLYMRKDAQNSQRKNYGGEDYPDPAVFNIRIMADAKLATDCELCVQYTYSHRWGGGGAELTREKVRGAIKPGENIKHD